MFTDKNATLDNFGRDLEMTFFLRHCKSEEKPSKYSNTEKHHDPSMNGFKSKSDMAEKRITDRRKCLE